MNGPSVHDGPGEIYGYQKNIKYIHNNYYIKIGMSIDAERRVLKQWKAQMMFKLYTPYRRLTESIAHLLLDYCRKKLVLENDKEQIEWFHINCDEDPIIILNSVSRFSNMYSNKIFADKFELEGIKYNKILDYNEKQHNEKQHNEKQHNEKQHNEKQLKEIIVIDDDNYDNNKDDNYDNNKNDNNDVIEIKGINKNNYNNMNEDNKSNNITV
jgi:hypothetical protein